ncbi:MAG: helix-turn-helix domain-containing protein [Hydrococcus sp. SU_1_0]|nr:helix-turn-helix domain-containing protein [Hydrococcus sp. SU_1_0]
MPRKAFLVPHYSSKELKQKYLRSQNSVESRRWHLLWKISLGWSIKNSAIAIGINYDYGKEIVKRYNNTGEEGIKNQKNKKRKQSGGRKSLLTKQQLEKLKKELELKPDDGGIWTGTKVARWIEKETGKEKVLDEPLVNQSFENIDEIENILAKRCNILNDMQKEIRDLTNYYWLGTC